MPTHKVQPAQPALFTGIAQSVEHWSPKPGVGSSSLSSRAKITKNMKLKILQDIEDSYNELRYKTSWPTKSQLAGSTVVVMVASIIIAIGIFIMDQVIDYVMHVVYSGFQLF